MPAGDHDSTLRLPLSVLKADPDNARQIGEAALAGLGVSLETFGPLDIVFNETTGELVSGHQRVRTLREAGATEVERDGEWGWIAHPKTGDRFPVRFVQWDETKQRMGNLVANNTALQGEFTPEALEQLKALEGEEGFAELELGTLEKAIEDELDVEGGDGPAGGNCDPDDVPDDVEPFSKRGDLWLLGDHRLLCGDSTSAEDVERLMGGDKGCAVVTDPPYGIGVDKIMAKQSGTQHGKAAAPKRSYLATDWDHLPPEELITELASRRQSIIFGGNYFALPPSRCWLVWDKDNGDNCFADCELAWTNLDQPVRIKRHLWNGMLRKDKEERNIHPTQKPVDVIRWCVEMTTGPVYDPFSGSGTTIIAAEQLGRRCFAMELEPRYVDVAVARWEKFTGRKAVRADGS